MNKTFAVLGAVMLAIAVSGCDKKPTSAPAAAPAVTQNAAPVPMAENKPADAAAPAAGTPATAAPATAPAK